MKFPTLSNGLQFSLSFILLALVGSVVLSIPLLHQSGVQATYFDHFLTSVSLVSVSGMAALPVGTTYNFWGQVICLILIQIGGLGVVTLINFGLYTMHRRISLRDQYMIQEVFSRDTNEDFTSFLGSIYSFTLAAELIGSLFLMIDFVPRYGWARGMFNAFFIAVSSFSNSGFDNLGNTSLIAFNNNPLVLLTVSALIILGGIGFIVWFELKERIGEYMASRPRNLRLTLSRLSIHTRIVLITTIGLLILGTVTTFLCEVNNPRSMVQMTNGQQFLNSFFKSVNTRTAGYVAIDYQALLPVTKFLSMVYTIIGGAPGGTAGGIKVTSFAMMLLLIRAELKGYNEVVVFHRTIPIQLIKKATMIVLFFIFLLLMGYSLLLLTHPHLNGLDLLFEAVNAIGTSGISLNTTQLLHPIGKIILVVLMLAGRIGPITLILGLFKRTDQHIHYADTTIHLG